MKVNNSHILDKIDAETLTLISTYGVKGWTMDTVREKSGVAKDTLYRIIGSKEKLVKRVIFQMLEKHNQRLAKVLEQEKELPALLQQNALLLAEFSKMLPTEKLAQVFLEYPSIEKEITVAMQQYFTLLIALIEQKKKEKTIKSTVNATLLSKIIHAFIMSSLKSPEGIDIKQDIQDFIQYLAYGITGEPAETPEIHHFCEYTKTYRYNLAQGLNYKLQPNKPEILEMPPQKMLVLPVNGDPIQQTAPLMPSLYSTAYALQKTCKQQDILFKIEKLRSRWPNFITMLAQSEWKGLYGLPVPNNTTTIPQTKDTTEIQPTLEEWHYGTTAQILHIGPYYEEAPAIETLLQFIEQNGYKVIANSHEEIYLTDPRKTTPDKFKTIILYRIEKQ